jgi:HlyD family secretion protein
VIFTVDAYPDITFTGKVRQIRLEPVVSANVVTYTTIVTAPNDDLKLRPGMTANIFIYTKEVDNALLIPSKALKFRPDSVLAKQFHLLAVDPGNKPRKNLTSARTSPAGGSSKHPANNQVDSSAGKNNLEFVWVQLGSDLEEKKIHIGLNDDTHVEVLDGLTVADSVVTGISQAGSGTTSVTNAAPKSTFMPTRPQTPTRSKTNSRP